MSTRFAEREARRAAGLPAVDDVETQLEALDELLREHQKAARALAKALKETRARLEELRRDLASQKKGRK